jgi:hypothetical protein
MIRRRPKMPERTAEARCWLVGLAGGVAGADQAGRQSQWTEQGWQPQCRSPKLVALLRARTAASPSKSRTGLRLKARHQNCRKPSAPATKTSPARPIRAASGSTLPSPPRTSGRHRATAAWCHLDRWEQRSVSVRAMIVRVSADLDAREQHRAVWIEVKPQCLVDCHFKRGRSRASAQNQHQCERCGAEHEDETCGTSRGPADCRPFDSGGTE